MRFWYFSVFQKTRSVLAEYAASIATRGLLHSNSSRSKHTTGGSGLGWKPLHKPQWYSVCKTVSNEAFLINFDTY